MGMNILFCLRRQIITRINCAHFSCVNTMTEQVIYFFQLTKVSVVTKKVTGAHYRQKNISCKVNNPQFVKKPLFVRKENNMNSAYKNKDDELW